MSRPIFQVMSKKDAELYSTNPTVQSYIIISINEALDMIDYEVPTFTKREELKDVLYLFFDDVETDVFGMVKEDAKHIHKFIDKWIDKVEKIIVHCGAGVSRSAGVCAGILKGLYNDDTQIFDNPRYCPNMHCYRLVVEEFLSEYDENEANEKLSHNVDIWKEKWLNE